MNDHRLNYTRAGAFVSANALGFTIMLTILFFNDTVLRMELKLWRWVEPPLPPSTLRNGDNLLNKVAMGTKDKTHAPQNHLFESFFFSVS